MPRSSRPKQAAVAGQRVGTKRRDMRWQAPDGTIWASRKDVSDGEKMAAGGVMATLAARFVVRSSELTRGLTPKDALIEGGKTFQIMGIKELDRRGFLEISAEARADL